MKTRSLVFCSILSSLTVIVGSPASSQEMKLPDPAVLARQRPEPAMVRGFTFRDRVDQKDYDDARAWGANVVRIHCSPTRHATRLQKEYFEALPSYLDQLETQIKQAKQAGMKVVVALFQPPFLNVRSFDQPEFWNRDDLVEPFCRAWTEIATRLLPYKDVIWGYDLLNEPLDRSQLPGVPKQWRPVALKIVEAIRKVDPDTWIIFEPGPGSLFNGFRGLEPLPDSRIIYSAHFYYPQEYTHQGVRNIAGTDLEKAMEKINLQYPSENERGGRWDKKHFEEIIRSADEFQAKWNVPIYVGEFSVIRWAPKESALRWLEDVIGMFEERGWSWCYHAFREFHGWSLEHDEQYWMSGMAPPQRVSHETERGKFVRSVLLKNEE